MPLRNERFEVGAHHYVEAGHHLSAAGGDPLVENTFHAILTDLMTCPPVRRVGHYVDFLISSHYIFTHTLWEATVQLFPGKPPRFKQDYSPYFLTFCTLKKKPILFLPGIPEFLIEELRFYSKHLQRLVAYTIMPDHIHLLVEIEFTGHLSAFLRDFKKFTSYEIKKRLTERRGGSSDPLVDEYLSCHLNRSDDRSLRTIWQPGTMDHCIRTSWDSNDYDHHLAYIFYNSQKHLGIAPKDYTYHNFGEFVEKGFFDEDFCSMNEKLVKKYALYERDVVAGHQTR